MAYSADTFVADEQPTTAKWNKLWANDAAFNDGTGIANAAITASHISGIAKNNLTTDSNPYKFHVTRNSAENSGNGSFAKINFDTEQFDTNNNFASGTYTAPVAGFYQFQARTAAAFTAQYLCALYKNGSLVERGDHDLASSGTAGVNIADLQQSAANDTWDIYDFGSGGAREVGISIYYSGFLVSRT